MKQVKKGQNCFECSKCNGFACFGFSKVGHWLDAKVKLNGMKSLEKSVRISKKKLKFITLIEYGKKYCNKFIKRKTKLKTTFKDYPYYISV